MTASEFVSAVALKATGKIPTFTSGSTKWLKILAIGNFYIDQWQNEPNVDWSSLYNPGLSFGTITATDTFAIPNTVRKISDTPGDVVRIEHTDGVGYTDYEIVEADELKEYYDGINKESPIGFYCAQIGSNLVFNHKFTSDDDQFGGTIKVPVYTFASHLSADSDTVPVDIPNWLVLITAAEYVRNDITKQNQYPNLVQEANEVMDRMKDDNEAQVNQLYASWNPGGQTW